MINLKSSFVIEKEKNHVFFAFGNYGKGKVVPKNLNEIWYVLVPKLFFILFSISYFVFGNLLYLFNFETIIYKIVMFSWIAIPFSYFIYIRLLTKNWSYENSLFNENTLIKPFMILTFLFSFFYLHNSANNFNNNFDFNYSMVVLSSFFVFSSLTLILKSYLSSNK